MSERNKIADLGENINNPLVCDRGIWGAKPHGRRF
jgi:hypothetical protein